VSNYPAFARVIRIISKWCHNGMVGADAQWRNQHDGGYTFTSPKDALHQKGYCWIYVMIHKKQLDGLYVGRTIQYLYDRFKQHSTGHPKRTNKSYIIHNKILQQGYPLPLPLPLLLLLPLPLPLLLPVLQRPHPRRDGFMMASFLFVVIFCLLYMSTTLLQGNKK
jgi:hypothetical protein